jgi:hypothetical protein
VLAENIMKIRFELRTTTEKRYWHISINAGLKPDKGKVRAIPVTGREGP